MTSLFQGWSENGKRIDWFYPVTPGRHILEPEDMVPLDAAYDVRLQLAWMNWEYQVDPDSGNYLCYLQTLVSVENGAVQTDKKDQAILEVSEYIQAVVMNKDAGAYLRVCEILEKSIYGQQSLEPYEMRTISAFMEKLEIIGGNTLNRKEKIELRYGYVVRIMEKIRRKTGQKGKTKKKQQKRIDKIKGKGHNISIKKH